MSERQFLVSVKVKDHMGRPGYSHFNVPEEVYTYIRQLENYIRRPQDSGLMKLYPDRFCTGENKYEKTKIHDAQHSP
jgi:hypothetical protein